MLRNLGSAFVALGIVMASATGVMAGTTDSNAKGALAPGGAAGVKKAQTFMGDTGLYILGGAVVVGGVLLVANGNGGHGVSTTTTTSP